MSAAGKASRARPGRPPLRALLAALALSAALAPATAAARASDDHWVECGDRAKWGISEIESHKVDCTIARRVAKHYWRTRDHHFGGWTCRSHQIDANAYRPSCREDGLVVEFLAREV